MNQLVNIGYGNFINLDKLISFVSPEAAPIKRMVQNAKDSGMAVDATCGRKTRTVLVMENGYLVLSALQAKTIAYKVNGKEALAIEEEPDNS